MTTVAVGDNASGRDRLISGGERATGPLRASRFPLGEWSRGDNFPIPPPCWETKVGDVSMGWLTAWEKLMQKRGGFN